MAFSDSELGDYSYVERQAEVIYAKIGKFCAIAANARINALEHPLERVSQHKITYRANEYFLGAKLDSEFRDAAAGENRLRLAMMSGSGMGQSSSRG